MTLYLASGYAHDEFSGSTVDTRTVFFGRFGQVAQMLLLIGNNIPKLIFIKLYQT